MPELNQRNVALLKDGERSTGLVMRKRVLA
jgi:hypothetical protein